MYDHILLNIYSSKILDKKGTYVLHVCIEFPQIYCFIFLVQYPKDEEFTSPPPPPSPIMSNKFSVHVCFHGYHHKSPKAGNFSNVVPFEIDENSFRSRLRRDLVAESYVYRP